MEYEFKWYEAFHYLAFFFVFIKLWPIYTWSPEYKLDLYLELSNNEFKYSVGHVLMVIQLVVYAVISILFVIRHLKEIRRLYSNTIYSDMVIIYRFLAIYLLYAFIVGTFVILFSSTDGLEKFDGTGTLVLSGGVLLMINWIIQNKSKVTSKEKISFSEETNSKYSTSSLSKEELKDISNKLTLVVKEKQLYRNCDLKISDLANETGFRTHHISQALNQYLQKSFFDFINEFRVEAIKRAIQDGTDLKNYSLTGLSVNFGFKSGSSFYRIFKKHTGCTPGEFSTKHL